MFCEPPGKFYNIFLSLNDDDTAETYDEMVETIIKKYEKPLIWRFVDTYQKIDYSDWFNDIHDDFEDSFFIIYDKDGYICLDVGYIYQYGDFERWGRGCQFFGTGYGFHYRKGKHITGKNKLRKLYYKLKYINNEHLRKNIIFEESFKNDFTSIIINDKEIFYKLLCYEDEFKDDNEIKFLNDEIEELFVKEFYNIHFELELYYNQK